MGKKILGAILIVLLIVGAAYLFKIGKPKYQEHQQLKTSDSSKVQIKATIALDNWVGYQPFRSSEMKSLLRQSGWLYEVVDDNADYADRMKKLAEGKYQFAVVTVDSYLLNAKDYNFPGSIVFVIDESKGGDAALCREDKVKNLDELRGKANIKIAFTPDSPSHFLGKAASSHFNVPEIMPPKGDPRRVETKGSDEAVKKLLAGTVDCAIAWEPDVSRALAKPGVIKILSTEDTVKLIVDILVVQRDFLIAHPQAVEQFMTAYFRTLKHHQDNPELFKTEIIHETKLAESSVEAMLKGVRWVGLEENCEKWFGIGTVGQRGEYGLIDTIESTKDVLIGAGDFKENPLPNKDPSRLVYSTTLERICSTAIAGFTTPKQGAAAQLNSLETRFTPLDEIAWKKLREFGTLKMENIIFRQGCSSELDYMGKEVIDEAVKTLGHYPKFRISVRGHTAKIGDEKENVICSQDRADAVARYLNVVYNIDPNRLLVKGYGSSKTLPMLPNEIKRAWEYRQARVELVLLRDELEAR